MTNAQTKATSEVCDLGGKSRILSSQIAHAKLIVSLKGLFHKSCLPCVIASPTLEIRHGTDALFRFPYKNSPYYGINESFGRMSRILEPSWSKSASFQQVVVIQSFPIEPIGERPTISQADLQAGAVCCVWPSSGS